MLKITSKIIIIMLAIQGGLSSNVVCCPWNLNINNPINNNTLSPKISISQHLLQNAFKHMAFDKESFNNQNLPGLIKLNPGWIEYFVDKKTYSHRFTGIIRPAAERNEVQISPEFWIMKQEFESINENEQQPYIHFMELENMHFSVIPWLQNSFPKEYKKLSQLYTDQEIFWYYSEQFYERLSGVSPFKIEIEGLWWGRPMQEQRISLRGFNKLGPFRNIQALWNFSDQITFSYAGFIQIQRELSEEVSFRLYKIFQKYKHTPLMQFTANDLSLAAITNNVLENDKTIIDIPLGKRNIPIISTTGSLLANTDFNRTSSFLINSSL